jgi:hypothetical protein
VSTTATEGQDKLGFVEVRNNTLSAVQTVRASQSDPAKHGVTYLEHAHAHSISEVSELAYHASGHVLHIALCLSWLLGCAGISHHSMNIEKLFRNKAWQGFTDDAD